jgi:hypothetical protein
VQVIISLKCLFVYFSVYLGIVSFKLQKVHWFTDLSECKRICLNRIRKSTANRFAVLCPDREFCDYGTEQDSQKIFDAIKDGIGFNPEIACQMHQK